VATELGFSAVSANSMDAVSDRDFLLDLHSASAACMMHLSRMAEEMVLWSSDEFAFVKMDDRFTTGSSIMPQKRNPDFAEIARGKSGRTYGNLMALLTVLKGLPLTYNRDMQEDKESLFDTVDSVLATLGAMAGVMSTMRIDADRMGQAARDSYALATDIADYLVAKGLPFREAHGVVSKLSDHAVEQGKRFDELPLDTYRRFSDRFDDDVLEISIESSVAARNVSGGTGFEQVRQATSRARAQLEDERAG
jgi:argininosuccinate lyase